MLPDMLLARSGKPANGISLLWIGPRRAKNTWDLKPILKPVEVGGVLSTAADYARFAQMLPQRRRMDGTRISEERLLS